MRPGNVGGRFKTPNDRRISDPLVTHQAAQMGGPVASVGHQGLDGPPRRVLAGPRPLQEQACRDGSAIPNHHSARDSAPLSGHLSRSSSSKILACAS